MIASTPAATAAAKGNRDGSGPINGTGAGPDTGLLALATVDFACAAVSFAGVAWLPLVSASVGAWVCAGGGGVDGPVVGGVDSDLGGVVFAGDCLTAFFAGAFFAGAAFFAAAFFAVAFFAGVFFATFLAGVFSVALTGGMFADGVLAGGAGG